MPGETIETLKDWLRTCLLAAREAEQAAQHEDIYAGDWGDRNEPWVHGHILLRLNDALRGHYGTTRSKGIHVLPEARVSWLDYSCGLVDSESHKRTVRGAPVKGLTPGQRFDLAVWDADSVRGLIEVKNAPRMDSNRASHDAERIHEALRRWGDPAGTTLEWGMIIVSERLSRRESEAAGSNLRRLRERKNNRINRAEQACPGRRCIPLEEPEPASDGLSLWWGMLIR